MVATTQGRKKPSDAGGPSTDPRISAVFGLLGALLIALAAIRLFRADAGTIDLPSLTLFVGAVICMVGASIIQAREAAALIPKIFQIGRRR